mgnify:CR=1 FL=1
MKIIRLYTGEDGESHFEDIEIPLECGGPIGNLSKPQKATSVIFRETADDYNYDWHNAPRKQYIIMLDAGVEIEVGDGQGASSIPEKSCWPKIRPAMVISAGH